MKTTFTTGNVDGVMPNICLVGYGDCSYYADDLTLTKVARNLPYCEEAYNLVPDGSFEKYLGRSGWGDLPEFLSINSVADEKNAASGKFYMTYSQKNGSRYVVPVVLPKSGRYVFAASIKQLTAGNATIWLAEDEEGNVYQKLASGYTCAVFTPKASDKYIRHSLEFNVDKANTTAYVVFEDNGGSYLIDDIQIFHKSLGKEENPNTWDDSTFDYNSLLPVSKDTTTKPDTENDNDAVLDLDLDDEKAEDNVNSSNNDTEGNTATNNNKDTDNEEESGFNWLIVIIIAGGILLALIAVVIILVIKRRKANHEA